MGGRRKCGMPGRAFLMRHWAAVSAARWPPGMFMCPCPGTSRQREERVSARVHGLGRCWGRGKGPVPPPALRWAAVEGGRRGGGGGEPRVEGTRRVTPRAAAQPPSRFARLRASATRAPVLVLVRGAPARGRVLPRHAAGAAPWVGRGGAGGTGGRAGCTRAWWPTGGPASGGHGRAPHTHRGHRDGARRRRRSPPDGRDGGARRPLSLRCGHR